MMIRLAVLLILLGAPAMAQPLCLCLKCATGAYRSYWAPAGSMKPTIRPGQCFIARTGFAPEELTPGTIITFRHPVTGQDFFKRIVAVGGQAVQMREGRLIIDGNEVPQTPGDDYVEVFDRQGPVGTLPRCANGPVPMGADCLKARATETLAGQSYDVLDIGQMPLDATSIFEVPNGHLFVLGDNRDNSLDSRVPQSANGVGFVPIRNVTGILDEIRP